MVTAHTPLRGTRSYVEYGVSVFRSSVFANVRTTEPTDLEQIYQELIAKRNLAAVEVSTRFYEAGSEKGIAELEAMLRETNG